MLAAAAVSRSSRRPYKAIISILSPNLHHLLSKPPPFLAAGWAARLMSVAELSAAPPFSVPHSLFLPRHAGPLFRSMLGFYRLYGDDIESKAHAITLSSTILAAEKEEARAALSLFLRKQGLGSSTAARVTNKSDRFIDHLISRLHSLQKSRHLVGRGPTTLEIREALNPYLDSLVKKHGKIVVELVENFPNSPSKDASIKPTAIQNTDVQTSVSDTKTSISETEIGSKKFKAMARVSGLGPNGQLPPHVQYLLDFGMDLSQIKDMARKFPSFAYCSLEGKVKPLIDLLLNLGVAKSNIPIILHKSPQLCGCSLEEKLKPTIKYLKKLGVDENQWAKIINRCPALLLYSRKKFQASVDYFYEMGVSPNNIGKILTRHPPIICSSVDYKHRPTGEYFKSMGVDVASLLSKCPQILDLSLEAKLKPMTEFFIKNGYDIKEIGTMVSRFGSLYTINLTNNLIPKWEYFSTLGYPKSVLIKYPQYFGFSLEGRIKPRFAKVKSSGVNLSLAQALFISGADFEKLLQKKVLRCSEQSKVCS